VGQIIYMCAPSHAISPSPSSFGPSSPRAPRELSARSMELSKKDRVMCVAVVDPFSFLGTSSKNTHAHNARTTHAHNARHTHTHMPHVLTCLVRM
jgi:hypothetical protein